MNQTVQGSPAERVVSLSRARDDKLWAVVAAIGRKTRVAEIYPSRAAADADRNWREQQVRAYAAFLRSSSMPVPNYSVSPIRRADLPRSWRPLPALGFLHGQFI
ncbi:hypothetical protein EAH89_00815 [Roseomonas nepalensis]|uniref:Uncharacterized protein n=1 Tax=Muricoccus nepalensis TaxID=1854500 RepID=A0A502GFQ2_9PROT|nr:hypothetical protein [Roseomonas nepalensis]TPG61137.1 hypothetical protein EAH89_00815 [Roseomonas nepalensis]